MFVVLLISFLAIVVGFYLVYVPMKSGIDQAAERRKQSVAKQLDEMFIFIPLDQLGTIKLVGAALVAGILYLLSYSTQPPAPYICAGIGAIIGFYCPEMFIAWMKARRRRQFAEQLVDGLVLMANGLRAGFSLQQAIEMLVEEMKPPISQEFELVLSEFKMGVDLEKALQNCVVRTKDPDLDLAVIAMAITRQLGGNVAEIFDRIVTTVRARKILEGKVNAMTAQGRMQAMVVGLLPYVFGFMLMKIQPELVRLLWTTLPGFFSLGLVIVLDIAGYFWVRKVATVKY